MTLHQLGMKYETDKATWHGFCNFYEHTLKDLQHKPIRFLELGILKGASLRMWREWFSVADIHAADYQSYDADDHPGVTLHVLDLENSRALRSFSKKQGQFDVIIDDAGHTMQQQQQALHHLWANVKPGGYFIVEDLHTSFLPSVINKYGVLYNAYDDPTTYDLLVALGTPEGHFDSQWLTRQEFDPMKSEIESIMIWSKQPNVFTDSVTAIIKKRSI